MDPGSYQLNILTGRSLPAVVSYILRYNIGKVKRVIHGLLRILAVASWGHVSSAPVPISVVLISRTEARWDGRVRTKLGTLTVCHLAVDLLTGDSLGHPERYLARTVKHQRVGFIGVKGNGQFWQTIPTKTHPCSLLVHIANRVSLRTSLTLGTTGIYVLSLEVNTQRDVLGVSFIVGTNFFEDFMGGGGGSITFFVLLYKVSLPYTLNQA